MRLYPDERKALDGALQGVEGEVYLFGSRVHEDRRGGDIDLLVFSRSNAFELSLRIAREFHVRCDERIDVLVVDPEAMTDEQEAFVATLDMVRLQ